MIQSDAGRIESAAAAARGALVSNLNPKHQTHMQRLGFNDPDLKTPAHDAILFWVRDNFPKIAAGIFPLPSWDADVVAKGKARAASMIANRVEAISKEIAERRERQQRLAVSNHDSEKARAAKLAVEIPSLEVEVARLRSLPPLGEPPTAELVVNSYRVEVPLGNGNERSNMVVGYLDASALVRVPTGLEIRGGRDGDDYSFDLKRWSDPSWFIEGHQASVTVEVKTSIPSFGELMRQLNTYRYYSRAVIVVVAPDDRFAADLKVEGIHFVKYTGELPAGAGAAQGKLL